jgi:L-iditol 2-dehydrogenase
VESPIPRPKADQIVVRVKAAGICGSDIECFEGRSTEGRYDLGPYTPGHEWAGEVVEVGDRVTSFSVGDMVTADCVLNCFRCENCKRGLMPAACLNFREVGFRPDSPGGWGEYLAIEDMYAHRLPEGWTAEEGALVEPFSVGYYGWVDTSDDVVIFGAGPIGLSALIVCKIAGARVIVVEPVAMRRELAGTFGADVIIDPTAAGDFRDEIRRNADPFRGPSLLIEASGSDEAIAAIFDVAGHQPRVRLIGHSVGHKVPVEIGKTLWRGISMYGQGGISSFMPRTITFMDRIRSTTDLTALITHRIPFARLDQAMELAVDRKAEAVKVMLSFEASSAPQNHECSPIAVRHSRVEAAPGS